MNDESRYAKKKENEPDRPESLKNMATLVQAY